MDVHNEVERLKSVYEQYQVSGHAETQWSEYNLGNQAILRERNAHLKALMLSHASGGLSNCRILDVGCGTGKVLAQLIEWGVLPANLYGVDLLEDRVEAARSTLPESHITLGNAEKLNFPDRFFDVVLLFTVLTSILDEQMARGVAAEVCRVLKPGGGVIWYDFRYDNPRNSNVRGMKKSAISSLFPDFDLDLRTVTLFPPLARRLGRAAQPLYPLLSRMPLLRTHYIGSLTKPTA
jgi:ubiquinone/menaquinone biosynthesis C-methylase UbiE